MRIVKDIVTSQVDGEVREVFMPECDCGSRFFVLFQIEKSDHYHLQCAECDTTYCPRGAHEVCVDG